MSDRGKVWTIGLVATSGLVASMGWDVASREISIPVVLLALGVCALIAEGSSLRSLARGRRWITPPDGARPADGVVDVVPIVGVEGSANAVQTRFQKFDRLADPGSLRSRRLYSTNPALLGKVVLVSVFIGKDGADWTDEEVGRAHQALEKVGLWIEREASCRNVPVNIGVAEIYFQVEDEVDDPVEIAFSPEGDDVGPMEANASSKSLAMASRAAARLGFQDISCLFERMGSRIEADSCVWLFHVRRAGRSFAIPAVESDLSGIGLAICYSREASFPEPIRGAGRVDASTVAHELLHLFGASDKYGVALRSFAKGTVTSRDIMRLNHDSLSRMTIDPLTAFEVGWLEREPGRG